MKKCDILFDFNFPPKDLMFGKEHNFLKKEDNVFLILQATLVGMKNHSKFLKDILNSRKICYSTLGSFNRWQMGSKALKIHSKNFRLIKSR